MEGYKATFLDGATSSPPKQNCSCAELFKKISPIILEHEGGYVNNPNDSGGETKYGITIGTFKTYAKVDLGIEPTSQNLKNLSKEQATIIYLKRYWEPRGYCKFKDARVALMVYDWTITSGGAIKEIQKLLNSVYGAKLVVDGGIGQATIDAINAVQDQNKLLSEIAQIRKTYYTNLAIKDGKQTKNYVFLKGWHNRVDKCLKVQL